MRVAGLRLGIDFGTSHTVAMMRWPDGRVRPLLFDGSPLLPSAVYADPAGVFRVGRDALHSARLEPARFEPNPKRRIDDGWVLLGDRDVEVVELLAAVLGRVTEEAIRTAGGLPATVTLSCPAAWGAPRRRLLGAAAARAGLGDVGLVEEPVAAATYFASVLGHLAADSTVIVYDFGGGTFDVSIVERTAGGFRTVAVDGRDDIGGIDLDAAVVHHVRDLYGARDPAAWQRLAAPATAEERRQRRLLWDDVRAVKERLSRHPSAELHVPGLESDAHVTREEFETLARPLLADTARLTADLLNRSGAQRERIAGVFMVGGSSRIPLVHRMVHRSLEIAPTVIEQPELVVAEGIVLTDVPAGDGTTVVGGAQPRIDQASTHEYPVPVAPAATPPAPRRRGLAYGVVAVLVAGALLAAAIRIWPDGGRDSSGAGQEQPGRNEIRADLLYDGSANGREVVLIARDGKRATLPAGGAVKTAVAVPGGWVVSRVAKDGSDSGQFLDATGRLLNERGRIGGMYVNTTGTRGAVVGDDGTVRVWDLTRNGAEIKASALTDDVHAVGWVGDRVLIRTRGDTSFYRYDYWDPTRGDYQPALSDVRLQVLGGRDDGNTLVAVMESNGASCLVTVDAGDMFRVLREPPCDGSVRLVKDSNDDLLPLVSPDGRTLLARNRAGEPAVFDVDSLIRGQAEASVLKRLGGQKVTRASWAAGTVFVQTPDRYLRCPTDTGECVAYQPGKQDGMAPTRLVVRLPASR